MTLKFVRFGLRLVLNKEIIIIGAGRYFARTLPMPIKLVKQLKNLNEVRQALWTINNNLNDEAILMKIFTVKSIEIDF